jgi:hypothetical protein
MTKETLLTNKERVYEIYGIPKSERKDYSIHHIVFKSDIKNGNGIWEGFDKDKKANLYPLKRDIHEKLHQDLYERDNR